jgi:DNA-binding transcriptional LysR family regulator
LDSGDLVALLADWSHPNHSYHIYYPDRRHMTMPLKVLIDALRRG